jgi:hypothetical protein
MGFDASDLAGIPVMNYASAHEILRQIDRQLETIRKPYEGNKVTLNYQKIEDNLLADLDPIRCLDRRAIHDIKKNCIRLNALIENSRSGIGDIVREALRGELPERVRLAKEIQADIRPLMWRCAWRFYAFLIIALIAFGMWKLHS